MKATPEDVAKTHQSAWHVEPLRPCLNEGHARRRGEVGKTMLMRRPMMSRLNEGHARRRGEAELLRALTDTVNGPQ